LIYNKEFHQLSLLACDIAKGARRKWLLDNRVQSPSGSGYAWRIELLWQMFFQLNKNIHRGKSSILVN
jgi:hypothetical protein